MFTEIKTELKFSLWDHVLFGDQKCKVIRRWTKMTRVNDELYYLEKFYTVKPEKGQRFKVTEEDLAIDKINF